MTNTSGFIHTFSVSHTLTHRYSHEESIRIKLHFFFESLQITSVKQIISYKMRARYTVSGEELSGSISGKGEMLMRDRVKVGWRIKCEHFCISYDTVAEKDQVISS